MAELAAPARSASPVGPACSAPGEPPDVALHLPAEPASRPKDAARSADAVFQRGRRTATALDAPRRAESLDRAARKPPDEMPEPMESATMRPVQLKGPAASTRASGAAAVRASDAPRLAETESPRATPTARPA